MPKELKSTISVILFVLILVVGYFFVYPQWSKVSTKRAELSNLKTENAELKKSNEEITTFVNSYKNYTEEQALAKSVLPLKDDGMDSAIRSLNAIAQTSNISIVNINVAPKANDRKVLAENGIEPIDLNLNMIGTYPAFNYFLQLLHQNTRLFDVLSVDMKAGNMNEVLAFQVRVRTYYQR
ncbi:MAG: type 4a pilus biogenesis protein PilO [Candidatus Saccharibacteria bacterium]